MEKVYFVNFAKLIDCKIDTGADCNVISVDYLKGLNVKIEKSNTKLSTFYGSILNIIGYVIIDSKIKNAVYKVRYYITKCKSMPVLGLPTIIATNLLQRIDVISNYNDIFEI